MISKKDFLIKTEITESSITQTNNLLY